MLSNLNGSIIGFNVFPMFLASVNGRRHQSCFWWKEHRQYTHWDLVKTNVWHTTLEIKDWKFLLHYIMSFEAFNNLVLELTHFLQSSCLNPIKPQLEIRKIVAIVIYWFVHGFSATHMVDRFNVGGSTIKKYVDIVCDVLTDKDKLFSKYINIPSCQHLKDIIPFLIGDVTYPNCNYLQKNWKPCNPTDVDKIRYDFNMNLKRVVIENAFGFLKNRWRSLKHFILELIEHHQL